MIAVSEAQDTGGLSWWRFTALAGRKKGWRGVRQAYAELGEDAATSKAAGISLKNRSVTGTGTGTHGDTGWISRTYTVVDGTGATVYSGSYLSVHRRSNGAWPCIRDIWNSDRPLPPPAPAPKALDKE